MNVTEQSMLSSYASVEILSARQKGRQWSPFGRRYRKAKLSETRYEVPRRKKPSLVGCMRPQQLLYAVFVMRMAFHQTRNQIVDALFSHVYCFESTRSICAMNLPSITVKYNSSAPCGGFAAKIKCFMNPSPAGNKQKL